MLTPCFRRTAAAVRRLDRMLMIMQKRRALLRGGWMICFAFLERTSESGWIH